MPNGEPGLNSCAFAANPYIPPYTQGFNSAVATGTTYSLPSVPGHSIFIHSLVMSGLNGTAGAATFVGDPTGVTTLYQGIADKITVNVLVVCDVLLGVGKSLQIVNNWGVLEVGFTYKVI